MAFELERIIGMLEDICGGDGTQRMAILVDCPVCGQPLTIDIDRVEHRLSVRCPAHAKHFTWEGDYTKLPAWIDRYPELNT
jgi:endogenous inhibitor of DNA gyrase (YacG/DUF329 family)